MKIAITAVSGHLGRAIAIEAINTLGRDRIIGLARTPDNVKIDGIEIRKGDYNQPDILETSLQGVNALILVSGMDTPQKRIIQHQNVINAAKKSGVKRIAYTSIYGEPNNTTFDSIILANRQTEIDIQNSGLQWTIGRNGLYLEADLESIKQYKRNNLITNCAGEGKCTYTTRRELARAYTEMITNTNHLSKIYNLCGPAITQTELTQAINYAFDLNLTYKAVNIEEYIKDRTTVHGKFLGEIIAGIYVCIQNNTFNVSSDFERVLGRPHQSIAAQIMEYLQS